MDVAINYWAVLAATASAMVVGMIWYARPVFGNMWIKLAKIDMSKNKGPVARPIVISLVASFLTAYILAHVAYLSNQFFQNSFFQDAVTTAFWLWLGFAGARIVVHDVFESRPWKLTLLTVSHEFVTIMIMGFIIGAIGS